MAEWLYDRQGQAQLFLFEEDRFISKSGRNLGWTFGNNVYSLIGMHVGWFENGILYDRNNRIIAFNLKQTRNLVHFSDMIGEIPSMPRIPVKPEVPGLSGKSSRSGLGGWSNVSLQEMFRLNFR